MSERPFRLVPPASAPSPLIDAALHLLPCHIEFDGPAAVGQYFVLRKDSGEDAPLDGVDSGERIATFRGRLLRGTPVTLPPGYEGRILRAPRMATVTKKPVASGGLKRPASAIPTAGPNVGTLKKQRRTSPRKAVQQATRTAFSLDDDTPPPSDDEAPPSTPSAPVASPYFSPRRGRSATASPAKAKAQTPVGTPQRAAEAEETSSFVDPLTALFEGAEADAKLAAESAGDASVTRDLTATARFDRFMIWTVDGMQLDRADDVYARAMSEWVNLSNLIHTS